MNEFFFFAHVVFVLGFTLIALRLGKSALVAFIAIQGILANLFVVKQISLFGFSVTCSDVFAIGCILSLNLLQEYFGKETARLASHVSLFSLFFFTCMSQIHLFYIPTPFDTTHSAFQAVFSSTPRIVLASIATFYIVQQWDIRFFSFLKGRFPLRVAISLISSQLLDTALFSFLGLYGLIESVFDAALLSFLIKCLIVAVSCPFVVFSKKVIRVPV